MDRSRPAVALAAALVIVATGCSSGSPPPSTGPTSAGSAPATVTGTVVATPGCPVEPATGCRSPEVADATVVLEGDHGARFTARTATDGGFALQVRPGAYTVTVSAATVWACVPRPDRIDVAAGRAASIEVVCDSGIRRGQGVPSIQWNPAVDGAGGAA